MGDEVTYIWLRYGGRILFPWGFPGQVKVSTTYFLRVPSYFSSEIPVRGPTSNVGGSLCYNYDDLVVEHYIID